MGVTTGADSELVSFEIGTFEFDDKSKIEQYSYRPFDKRFLNYDSDILARARVETMRHLSESDNIALAVLRGTRNDLVGNFFISKGITDKSIISSLDNGFVLSLYLYETEELTLLTPPRKRRANISEEFLADLTEKLGLELDEDADGLTGTLPTGRVSAFDVLAYAYGVFHSPEYRKRYAEFLKIDFPRLPLTGDRGLFWKLVELGGRLVKIHLLETELPEIAIYPAEGDNMVITVKFEESKDGTGLVWINPRQYFDNVPHNVWQFHIGGYQVCERWLKDRKGRTLSFDDIVHYKKVVSALSETIKIMAKIDDVIAEHRGFPFR
jgi:predicted helicase